MDTTNFFIFYFVCGKNVCTFASLKFGLILMGSVSFYC